MSLFDKIKKTKQEKEPTIDVKANAAAARIKPEKPVKTAVNKTDKDSARKFANIHNILIRPLVTEKTVRMGANNQYAFVVFRSANKVQIKKAIETYYHVKPVGVNIVNISGHNVRWGRRFGQTKSWKKAIVTLRPGDKIELYEGV